MISGLGRKFDYLTGAYRLGRDIGPINITSATTMRPRLDGHVRLLAAAGAR